MYFESGAGKFMESHEHVWPIAIDPELGHYENAIR
jgi:hypothetical protein